MGDTVGNYDTKKDAFVVNNTKLYGKLNSKLIIELKSDIVQVPGNDGKLYSNYSYELEVYVRDCVRGE